MPRCSGGTTRPAADSTRSPTTMRPLFGARNPASRRKVVVWPQPDGPSSDRNSPSSIVSVRSATALTSANFRVSPSIATRAMSLFRPRYEPLSDHAIADDSQRQGQREHNDAERREAFQIALLGQIDQHRGHDLR